MGNHIEPIPQSPNLSIFTGRAEPDDALASEFPGPHTLCSYETEMIFGDMIGPENGFCSPVNNDSDYERREVFT